MSITKRLYRRRDVRRKLGNAQIVSAVMQCIKAAAVAQARFHYRRTNFPVIAGEGDVFITINEGNIRVLSRCALRPLSLPT